MTGSKELKKNKLYLCELEYDVIVDETKKVHVSGWIVGYLRGKNEEDFFFGSYYEIYNGKMTGGETMNMTLKEFNDQVKSVKEIA